jgi:Cu+-exporting ATPase
MGVSGGLYPDLAKKDDTPRNFNHCKEPTP